MSSFTGITGVVKIATVAVAEVTEFSYDDSSDLVESHAMGDTNKSYEATFIDGGGSITCRFDPLDAKQTAMVSGATLAVELQPEGSTGGDFELAGNIVIESTSLAVPMADMVQKTFTYKGVLTAGTV